MENYKRLTNNNRDEYDPEYDFCCDCKYFGEPCGCNRLNGTCSNYDRFLETYNRLAELEDKIENSTLVELPRKVSDAICNKNIKFYLDHKEIPFEELSKLPQMTTDRENHAITEIVLNYIGKDAIYFYTKTEHYTVAEGADEEYYEES